MSIRYRLLFTMIALSSVAVVVCSLLAYANGRISLRAAALRQLAGIRRSRAYAVESFFRQVRDHCDSLSDDRMFIEGMQQFSKAYGALNATGDLGPQRGKVLRFYQEIFLPDVEKYMSLRKAPSDYLPQSDTAYLLQHRYVVPQSSIPKDEERSHVRAITDAYARVHAKYDPPIRKLASQFGYDDLLLIDLTDLQIVYSVAKNPDFGTSLNAGPYRDTPLANIVRQAAVSEDRDAVFTADFTRYEPAKGNPAAFVATPIFDASTRVGVFAMQLSTAEIDRVISGNRGWRKDGLGETGSLEIIGPDHLMRSTSRTFIEHPEQVLSALRSRGVPEKEVRRMKAHGTTILVTTVFSTAVDEGIQGREGTVIESGLFGNSSYVSFMPLWISGLR